MKEFVINEFLTLKLEDGKTNIYVKGERFNQCKFLLFEIPVEEIKRFDEIESIDEVANMLGWSDENLIQGEVDYKIDPETEFWGHCSNLQVWVEHGYDTRLLHSNLSFPLLRKLVEVGDQVAKGMFKKEIVKRFESGYPTVVAFIFISNILNYLTEEERRDAIVQNLPVILNALEKLPYEAQSDLFRKLISFSKETDLLEKYFSLFLESVDKFTGYDKHYAFSILFDSIKNTKVLKEFEPQIESKILFLLNKMDTIVDEDDYNGDHKYYAFYYLIEAVKAMGVAKEHIPIFLKSLLDNFDDESIDYESYGLYNRLLSAITDNAQRFEILKTILENAKDPYLGKYLLNDFFTIVDDLEFVKEKFSYIILFFEKALMGNIYLFEYEFSSAYNFIVKFVEKLIDIGFLNVKLTVNSSYYSSDYSERLDHSSKGFFTLIEEIKDTEIMEHLFPILIKTSWLYSDAELVFEHYKLFFLFFEIAYKKKLLDKHFIDIVVFYNWNYVGIKNLLENFLKYFTREQIVSMLAPALNNLELLLEHRHYQRILAFFGKFTKERENPFLKAFIVNLLKKNSCERVNLHIVDQYDSVNLHLLDQHYLHYLEVQDWMKERRTMRFIQKNYH